jgi:predicted RNA-binding Zn-ribbon protein involved in translation (DUF1610 family)
MVEIWALLVVVVSIGIYFIPYILAEQNKKQNAGAIGALNLFLRCTLIGWVAALVWAMSKAVSTTSPSTTPASLPAIVAQKKCPDCAEVVLSDARKCRFSGHKFVGAIPLMEGR